MKKLYSVVRVLDTGEDQYFVATSYFTFDSKEYAEHVKESYELNSDNEYQVIALTPISGQL